MPTRETSRFHIPYPGYDDRGNWDAKIMTMMAQLDANIFANMEHLRLVYAELPTVTNDAVTHELTQVGDFVLISRTFHNTITVAAGVVLTLQPTTMIGVRITSGITTNQTSVWETVANGADVDPDFQVLGYVDAAYNIYWYNGAMLIPGDTARLFFFTGTGAGGTTVMVTGADTVASYLDTKIVAGTNVTTTVLAPGPSGETLQIDAAGPGDVLSWVGNPNGVVSGNLGQVYVDTAGPTLYMNTTGAQVWAVI